MGNDSLIILHRNSCGQGATSSFQSSCSWPCPSRLKSAYAGGRTAGPPMTCQSRIPMAANSVKSARPPRAPRPAKGPRGDEMSNAPSVSSRSAHMPIWMWSAPTTDDHRHWSLDIPRRRPDCRMCGQRRAVPEAAIKSVPPYRCTRSRAPATVSCILPVRAVRPGHQRVSANCRASKPARMC